MKDWLVSVYKTDKRCKAGERFVAKYPFSDCIVTGKQIGRAHV